MDTECMESGEGFLFLERTFMGNISADLFKVISKADFPFSGCAFRPKVKFGCCRPIQH